ncbi:MAG: MTH1187 family thiamine-binding protein [Myxococcales bacterium]|nr:MTH1187 family thiamine-binding protein [Myxococcales bacterium]
MNVMVDFMLVPIGVGVSLSPYIAACQEVLESTGLTCTMHAYGTTIEGEWEAVFAAVRACHERVHEMGAPRISTTIKCGTRTDRKQTAQDKIDSVQRILDKTSHTTS